MQKINGLTRKPHLYQIISYIFFSALAITYYFIIFLLSSEVSKIISIIIISISGVFIVISGYLATSTDPSDSNVIESRKARFEKKTYEPTTREFYCGADHTYVKSGSKHCRRCNRCTEGFDHHCKWINNDVGKANYRSFFVMICSVLVFLVTYIVFAVILTVNFANDTMLMENDTYLYADDKDRILAGMIIMWIMMVLAAAFLMLDTNLVLFHIFLQMKGLTTFQYITIVEERKENMKELEQAMKMLGTNRKTCLDFILCLKKRKPRTIAQGETKNGEIELGNAGNKEEKKENQAVTNQPEQDNVNKDKVKKTENESPGVIESPDQGQNLCPIKTEEDEKEVPDRTMAVSREINHTRNGPVVINIAHDQDRKKALEKKHTVSQIEVQIKKEDTAESQTKSGVKILTPSSNHPRVGAYSVGNNLIVSESQRNMKTTLQLAENSTDGLLPYQSLRLHESAQIKQCEQSGIGRMQIENTRGAEL